MKKICLILLLVFTFITLIGCEDSDNTTINNNEVVKKVSLNEKNYQNYLNLSYTVSVNGPKYGELGFDYYFTVSITSLNPKYTFSNVEIVFNKNSATKFRLSTTGNTTFTLTSYETTNNVVQTVKINKISGTVKWTE